MNKKANSQINSETDMAMKVLQIGGMILLGGLIAVLLGFVLMWLWNALMPTIFMLPEITYWQGVGLFILSKILFGGVSGNSSSSKEKTSEKGEIYREIESEVKKDIETQYYKDHPEDISDDIPRETMASNQEKEAVYEAWWEKEGEKMFNDYLAKENEDNNHL